MVDDQGTETSSGSGAFNQSTVKNADSKRKERPLRDYSLNEERRSSKTPSVSSSLGKGVTVIPNFPEAVLCSLAASSTRPRTSLRNVVAGVNVLIFTLFVVICIFIMYLQPKSTIPGKETLLQIAKYKAKTDLTNLFNELNFIQLMLLSTGTPKVMQSVVCQLANSACATYEVQAPLNYTKKSTLWKASSLCNSNYTLENGDTCLSIKEVISPKMKQLMQGCSSKAFCTFILENCLVVPFAMNSNQQKWYGFDFLVLIFPFSFLEGRLRNHHEVQTQQLFFAQVQETTLDIQVLDLVTGNQFNDNPTINSDALGMLQQEGTANFVFSFFQAASWIIVITPVQSGLALSPLYLLPIVTCMALFLFVSLSITRTIGYPLKQMAKYAAKIAEFDMVLINDIFEEPFLKLSVDEMKELRYLRKALNCLVSTLRSFMKYVPVEVVQLLLKVNCEAVLGADETEVTILFSDIVDFTRISESITTKSLIELMGKYLEEMSSIIVSNNGIVDKYIGDAIMAMWNAPLVIPNHSLKACIAALEQQKRLECLRQEWLEKSLPSLYTRIGIHSGVGIVGHIGSNYRFSYTCLGEVVNISSTLEGLNKKYGTKIIISEPIFKQVCHKLLCRQLGFIKTRTGEDLGIYELVGYLSHATLPLLQKVKLYNEAMSKYLEEKYEECLEKLEMVLEMDSKDGPSNSLKELCLSSYYDSFKMKSNKNE